MELLDKLSDYKIREINNLITEVKTQKYPDYSRYFQINTLNNNYHHLFDQIDWELKCIDELNDKINYVVSMHAIIDFDLKKYFYKIDENNIIYYDEQKKIDAVNFCNSWPETKNVLEKKLEYYSSKKHFKVIFKEIIRKLNLQIKNGQHKYEKLLAIFELEEKAKELANSGIEKEVAEIENEIMKEIDVTMEKHIDSVFKTYPEIIIFGKIPKNMRIFMTSSAFLTNEKNENLNLYFDSNLLTKKLNTYLKEFEKEFDVAEEQKQ